MTDTDTDTAAYFYSRARGEIVVVLQYNRWAVRNLKAKGIFSMQHILTRSMTAVETADSQDSTRLHFVRYRDWSGFFADEQAVETPPRYISRLKKFSSGHPLAT